MVDKLIHDYLDALARRSTMLRSSLYCESRKLIQAGRRRLSHGQALCGKPCNAVLVTLLPLDSKAVLDLATIRIDTEFIDVARQIQVDGGDEV